MNFVGYHRIAKLFTLLIYQSLLTFTRFFLSMARSIGELEFAKQITRINLIADNPQKEFGVIEDKILE